MKPDISIIIPAFNEAARIQPTLVSIGAYLKNYPQSFELIVVDDGSTDNTVDVIAQAEIPNLAVTVICHSANKGKGAAVRTGMMTATGTRRLFMDADSSTHIRELDKLLPYLDQGYDVVIGSRRIRGSLIKVKQRPIREILGWAYRMLSHAIASINVADSQNGFKLFSEPAAKKIFGQLKTVGWSFDVEALVLARENGFRTAEVPIVWENDGDSRLKFPDMVRMLVDLVLIRARH